MIPAWVRYLAAFGIGAWVGATPDGLMKVAHAVQAAVQAL